MAPIPTTPRRSGAGRPRKSASRPKASGSSPGILLGATASSEPPPKKRRYIPGGPGGGGRYVDEDGTEIPVGGTGPGGYNYVGPRGRVGRENAEKGIQPVVYPRRERSARTRTVLPRSQQPQMRFTSAAQAAAAVAQSDGYKPREERGWEEFHPDLDIDAKLAVFSAEEVDGIVKSRPVTPADPQSIAGSLSGLNGSITPTGTSNRAASFSEATPAGSTNGDLGKTTSLPSTPGNKRRPGRPPRDPIAFYAAREAASSGMPNTPRIAPLQSQNAKERLTLPNPSFRKVDALAKFEDKASGQVRYVDKSMANVGYQETDIFVRPERVLIKASDANNEEDLDMGAGHKTDSNTIVAIGGGGVGRVEYDMDEQDDKWLEVYNAERKTLDIEPITREIFEITITKIEKEWHALEKRIPKPNPKPPQTHRPRSSSAAAVNGEPLAGEEQDSKCAICDDGDCENTNAIVFCDGCDLAVHQECYGVPFIPEGQWLCRKCQLIGRGIPTCIFCPNTDGGFKQANSSRWAHLLCAMWIPEVSLGNHTFMEPVMDVEKVPKSRWKLTCYICQQRMGACIQCGNKACFQAFHVTCARRARLYLKMKNSHGTLAELDNNTQLKAFCDKHCPADYTKQNDVPRATREARIFYRKTMKGRLWADSQASALAMAASHQHAIAEHPQDESQSTGLKLSITVADPKKRGTPGKPVWKLPSGAPVIPFIVFDSVEASLQRFTIRRRKEWAAAACRYWTLKRESRRGAALLKRLQLQMEAFSSMELTRRNFAGMGHAGRPRLQRRIEFARILLEDLERLKVLSNDIVARETEKLKSSELEVDLIDTMFFPIAKQLPPMVEKALTLDIKKTFTQGLLNIQSRLNRRYYVLATALAQDLSIVFSEGIESGSSLKTEEHTSSSRQAVIEIKERRKLAKRIIKAIQPQLEAAVRAEADLTKKSADLMIQDLEALLEACLTIRPESLNIGGATAEHGTAETVIVENMALRNELSGTAEDGLLELTVADDPMDVDLHDEDAPGEEVDDNDIFAAIPVQEATTSAYDDDGIRQASETSMRSKSGFSNSVNTSTTPPDVDGYDAVQEYQGTQPPTPPVSNGGPNSTNGRDHAGGDLRSFLTEGGNPWYLKDLDPIGALLVEQPWTGREAAGSEELSEIDDDELKGLEVDADFDAMEDGEDEVDAKIAAAKAKKNARARKRRKLF